MAGATLGKRGPPNTEQFHMQTRGSKRFRIAQDDCSNHSNSLTAGNDSIQPPYVDNSENTPPPRKTSAPCTTAPSLPTASPNNEAKRFAGAVPQTPRHKHSTPQKVPITPKHRVLLTNKLLTPSTPRTPSTPVSTTKSVYNDARKAFTRGADPGQLIARDTERNELQNFIGSRVSSKTGGALYVSGPPGTGKTALVSEICRAFKSSKNVRCASLNCMSVQSSEDLFVHAAAELGLSNEMPKNDTRGVVRAACLSKKYDLSFLVILDEIDQLVKVNIKVLYELFEWAFAPQSRLILVGIANALDLTDRFLPRLKARNLKPDLLPFLPYTVAEIQKVLSARCRSLLPKNAPVTADFTPFLHPAAIQLISKKVASQTGDLRKAFDIARCAIDLVESETRGKAAQKQFPPSPAKTPLAENLNLSSPRSSMEVSPTKLTGNVESPLLQLTAETAPRATLAHITRVTTAAFGNSLLQRFKALNLQQKAILCNLVTLETNNRHAASMPSPCTPAKNLAGTPSSSKTSHAAPTMRDLLDAYTSLCKQDNILCALSSTEFRDVVANLETASLVTPFDGKLGSLAKQAIPGSKGSGGRTGCKGDERRISARIGLKDIEAGIEGIGSDVLRNILRRTC